MFEKRFERKIENFKCNNCGASVEGTGYTDHCPVCLWSKHVDINPGDRKAECQGMMEPVGVETKKGGYVIYYKCTECNYPHRVKSASNDSIEELIRISSRPIKK